MKQIKGLKMKIAKKNTVKKQKMKSKVIVKPKKEQVLVVAQEIKFATLLSGNDKKTRDRALKTLKKWLLNCFQKGYVFKEGDFTRIWKGLFYAVWMSDKPLVQEDLCESIAGLLDMFPAGRDWLPQALLLVKVGLKVLASEWFGIDQHRLDKYLMLVRRWVRASLRCVRRGGGGGAGGGAGGWRARACAAYAAALAEDDGLLSPQPPLYARNATSMILHFTDCFLEELAKVSEGDIPEASVAELMRPFCQYVCCGTVPSVCVAARRLLTALLKQSEPALEYRHKTIAWEKMGCPAGGPDALELVSDDGGGSGDELGAAAADAGDDDDDDGGDGEEQASIEKPLDPRAGRVNVELATIPVPCEQLAATLRSLLPAAPTQQAQRRARVCMQRFEAMSRAEYPLRVSPAAAPAPAPPAPSPGRAAAALSSLEKKLASECDELALRGLSRKHRKRVLARRRAGESVVGDVTPAPAPAPDTAQPSATNGDWQVEDTEPQPKKRTSTQDTTTSNKENVNRTKKNISKRDSSEQHVAAGLALALAQEDDTTDRRKETKNNVNETKVRQKQLNEFKKVKNKGESIKSNVENKGTKEKSRNDSSQSVIKENFKKNQEKQQQQQITEKNENNKNWKKEKNNSKNKNIENNIIMNGKNKSNNSTNKSKNMQKMANNSDKNSLTPKKVKFVLKNNSMQGPVDYYRSVRQSPNIPFDSKKQPSKTNLKPSTPSPINPFLKKKLKLKN